MIPGIDTLTELKQVHIHITEKGSFSHRCKHHGICIPIWVIEDPKEEARPACRTCLLEEYAPFGTTEKKVEVLEVLPVEEDEEDEERGDFPCTRCWRRFATYHEMTLHACHKPPEACAHWGNCEKPAIYKCGICKDPFCEEHMEITSTDKRNRGICRFCLED